MSVKKVLKNNKKWLTRNDKNGIILKLTREGQRKTKNNLKKLKKFLTNEMSFDKILKLSLEKNDRNLDN